MGADKDDKDVRREAEGAMLLAVARGDVEALRAIYRAFERPLYALGRRWLRDEQMAQELVQEVTLRIWRRAATFDPAKGAAGSWIFGVARNVAADLARSAARNPIPVEEPRDDSGARPWDEERAWQGWQVVQALGRIPAEQRRVVELAYVHQLTQSEISEGLGIPLGTVKTRLYAGLAKLRTELVKMGILEVPE